MDVHTCHDNCPRRECVLRREVERLRALVEQAYEDGLYDAEFRGVLPSDEYCDARAALEGK